MFWEMHGACHNNSVSHPLSRAECNASAVALDLPAHSSLAHPAHLPGQPSGCFVSFGAEVRYNADERGQARMGRTLVCGLRKQPVAEGVCARRRSIRIKSSP